MPFLSGLLVVIGLGALLIILAVTLFPGLEAAAIGSAVGFAYAHGYHVRTKEQQP